MPVLGYEPSETKHYLLDYGDLFLSLYPDVAFGIKCYGAPSITNKIKTHKW